MSKELTPLKALREMYQVCLIANVADMSPEFELIEKTLKALEIIKEKPLVALIDYHYNTYEEWLSACSENSDFENFDSLLIKTKEEYDLLKEVLS